MTFDFHTGRGCSVGFYDTHNHLDKIILLMLGVGKGYVYWG